jgi:hypothetical protein
MDVVKICEVVDGCEDCPKYGDDCDGDKMTEHTDLISRADAIKAIRKCKFESVMPSDWYRGMECAQDIVEELPSADALLKQEIDFHKEVSRIEAEKVVDLEHKLAEAVQGDECDHCVYKWGMKGGDTE